MGPFGKSPTPRGDDILFWKVQLCLLCWNVEIFVRTEVQCWCKLLAHSVCSVPSDTTSCSNIKVWKVTKNRTGMWVMLSQAREMQAVLHMRFLNCSQRCLFWISLHVGILIQLLLLESCWRELLSFHLRKLTGLGWTMSWLSWSGVGSRWTWGRWRHLQGSLLWPFST